MSKGMWISEKNLLNSVKLFLQCTSAWPQSVNLDAQRKLVQLVGQKCDVINDGRIKTQPILYF